MQLLWWVVVVSILSHVLAAWQVSSPTTGLSALQYGASTLSGLKLAGGAGSTGLRLQINVNSGRVNSLATTAGVTLSPSLPAAIFTATGTATALGAAFDSFVYAAPGSGFGDTSDSIQFTLFTTSPFAFAAVNTSQVAITLVNHAPVWTLNGNSPPLLTINEAGSLLFDPVNLPALSVADDSNGNAIEFNLTLSPSNAGGLQLSTTAGISFLHGTSNGQAGLSFTATVSAINSALNGMRFNSVAPFSGTATLTVIAVDNGFGGSNAGVPTGPVYTTVQSYTITVQYVPTIPVLTVPTTSVSNPLRLLQSGELPVSGISVSDTNLGPTQTMYIPTLSISCSGSGGSGAAVLVLTQPSGVVFTPGGTTPLPTNSSAASLPFEGTLSTVNSALASVLVRSVSSTYAGPCTLTIRAANADTPLGSQPVATIEFDVVYTNAAPIASWLTGGAPLGSTPVSMARDTTFRFGASNNPSAISALITDPDAVPSAVLSVVITTNLVPDPMGAGTGTANLTLHTADASIINALNTLSGQGTPTLQMSGTLNALNQALNVLAFRTPLHFYGSVGLTIAVNDNGATGAGPARSNSASITLTVAFVRYPLTLSTDAPSTATSPNLPTSVVVGQSGIVLSRYVVLSSFDAVAGQRINVSALALSIPAFAIGSVSLQLPSDSATAAGVVFDVGTVTARSIPFGVSSIAALNQALSALSLVVWSNLTFPPSLSPAAVQSFTANITMTVNDGQTVPAPTLTIYFRVYSSGLIFASSTGVFSGSTGMNDSAVVGGPNVTAIATDASANLTAADMLIPIVTIGILTVGALIMYRAMDTRDKGGTGVGTVRYLAPKFRQGRLHDLPATLSTKLTRNFQYSHLWWSVLDSMADVDTHDTSTRGQRLVVLHSGLMMSICMIIAVLYDADPGFDGIRERHFVREPVIALIASLIALPWAWGLVSLFRDEHSGRAPLRSSSLSIGGEFEAMALQNKEQKAPGSGGAIRPASPTNKSKAKPGVMAHRSSSTSPRKYVASPALRDPNNPNYASPAIPGVGPNTVGRTGASAGGTQIAGRVPPLPLGGTPAPTAVAGANESAPLMDPERILIPEHVIKTVLPHPLLMAPLSTEDGATTSDESRSAANGSAESTETSATGMGGVAVTTAARPMTPAPLSAPSGGDGLLAPPGSGAPNGSPRAGGAAGLSTPSPRQSNVLSYKPLSEATRRLFDVPRAAPLHGSGGPPPASSNRAGVILPPLRASPAGGPGAAAAAAAATASPQRRAAQVNADLNAAANSPLPNTPAPLSIATNGTELKMHMPPTHSTVSPRSAAAGGGMRLSIEAGSARRTPHPQFVTPESPNARRSMTGGFGAAKPAAPGAVVAGPAPPPAPSPLALAYKRQATLAALAPPTPHRPGTPGGAAHTEGWCSRNRILMPLLLVWAVGCIIVTLVMTARFSTQPLPDSIPWSLSGRWVLTVVYALMFDCFILEPIIIVCMMASGCGLRVLYQ